MITIKYKGVEATCTTVEEAVELIKKLEKLDLNSNYNRYLDLAVQTDTKHKSNHIGINECHTNLPDDYDNYISKVNSIDNYKLPDDYDSLYDPYKAEEHKSVEPLDYME